MLKRRSLLAVLLAIVTSLTLFACAEETPPAADEPADQPADTDMADTAEPAAGDLTIVASDYAFEFPASVASGNHMITLENEGEEIHQAIVVELLEGKTVEDALEYIETTDPEAPPPSWVRVAGVGFAEPGKSGPVQASDAEGNPIGDPTAGMDLTSGNYFMLCLIPEGTTDQKSKPAKDAQPHAALGMVHGFTVQ